jgi:hypothetical protein
MHAHLPHHDLLGPDPEPLSTERYGRIMAALNRAADARTLSLPERGAQHEQRTALAA